ncbi:hypothetical protein [Altererythrobacter sp. ZODW24]|uniref:hypothetical protein n=1 Tax=Altererythrobacter sp. ZODW24 TaxID=2185142 RepID=UPI001F07F560|nr:hypothetical protein [Altererythrobacter sp. ZODW24]
MPTTPKRARSFRHVSGVLLAAGLLVTPVMAAAPDLAVLDGLQKGMWDVRFRDGTPARKVCVRTGRELMHLGHRTVNCPGQVVSSTGSSASLQYQCSGNGHGHTDIRRETRTLVQIDSRGIAGGRPFDFSAEARRTGTCR